jgi:hypothetical protein
MENPVYRGEGDCDQWRNADLMCGYADMQMCRWIEANII